MKVDILGTEYEIVIKKYDEEEAFGRRSICGYCDGYIKEIVVCDMSTYKGWEYEGKSTIAAAQNETIRHEIVHAFLNESGLCCSALSNDESGWARNEEMVDWIAIQFPKILKAFKDVNCL